MPKKFGINSKSAEAREKKQTQKKEAATAKQREEEDAYWADDGTKKQQAALKRKQEQEEKRLREQQHAAEKKALMEKEVAELAKTKISKQKETAKITRTTIESLAEIRKKQEEKAAADAALAKARLSTPVAPERNVNQEIAEFKAIEQAEWGDNLLEAHSLEEAIDTLHLDKSKAQKHPLKRLKGAFKEFQDKNMPILKAENPSLKLSQLKELLWKMWQKAPENPLNEPDAPVS